MLLAMSHFTKGHDLNQSSMIMIAPLLLHSSFSTCQVGHSHQPTKSTLHKVHTEDSVPNLQSLQVVLVGFVSGYGMVQKLCWDSYFLYGWCRLLALHKWRARAPAQRGALLLHAAVLHDHRGSLGAGQQRRHVCRGTLSLPSPTLACLNGAAMYQSAHESAHMRTYVEDVKALIDFRGEARQCDKHQA